MSVRPRYGASSGAFGRDDGDPTCGEGGDRLGVRLGDTLDGADELEVLGPDRGDDRDVGPCDLAERGDLSESAHAHLRDEHAGVALEPADGERKADLVVLARLRPDRGRGGVAERPEDVLGRGLAGRADDGDDARLALRADERGECSERGLLVVGDERGGASRRRVGDVRDAGVQRDEEIAGADEPGVRLDARDRASGRGSAPGSSRRPATDRRCAGSEP